MTRIRYHHPSDGFKYLEKDIILNSEGKFWVPDYGTEHDSLDDAKAEIKSRQVKREQAPKQDVWCRSGSYTGIWGRGKYIKGRTTGHLTGRHNQDVIVTTEESRQTVAYKVVYPATNENNALVSQITKLEETIKKLEDDRDQLVNKLTPIKPLE